MKTCTKCNVAKSIEGFHKNKRGVLGLESHCKDCANTYKRAVRRGDIDKIPRNRAKAGGRSLSGTEAYYVYRRGMTRKEAQEKVKENLEKRGLRERLFEAGLKECSLCKKGLPVEAFHKHAGMLFGLASRCRLCTKRTRNQTGKNKASAPRRERFRDKEKKRIDDRNWYLKKKRCHKYALSRSMRNMVRRVMGLCDAKRHSTTCQTLGYLPEQLRQRMEYGFLPGMSWDNYGEWHIDHKIPVSLMIERGETRPEIINALSNLQPMWASDNSRKGNRLVG